jgi:hypothetical protein
MEHCALTSGKDKNGTMAGPARLTVFGSITGLPYKKNLAAQRHLQEGEGSRAARESF